MSYFVYMILSKHRQTIISYVGYTNNLLNRLTKHNSSKGAKFTKGKYWEIIYFKKYSNKISAMKDEYKLKNDRIFRNKIKNRYINKL